MAAGFGFWVSWHSAEFGAFDVDCAELWGVCRYRSDLIGLDCLKGGGFTCIDFCVRFIDAGKRVTRYRLTRFPANGVQPCSNFAVPTDPLI